ncbi:MAG: hypothetical protein LBR52_00020 [Prevotellaceae bacterium]|jgi:hypothetical protein|nr:hypothetical protein [Prevotellaceae bacterium]
MKVSIRRIVLVAFVAGLFSISASSFAQETVTNETAMVDHRLWGTWDLDTVELTRNGVTKKYALDVLLADKNNLPRNMFTQLYFFANQIGVSNTEEEFIAGESLNLKGSFTVDNGNLIVTMQEEHSRVFTYTIENKFLKIWFTRGDTQFYLIYSKDVQ